MLHIAIVEDEKEYQEAIKNMIMQYGKEKHKQFSITIYGDGIQIVQDYQKGFDIILLDIEMPNMNGMEAAKKIREKDKDAVLVFITNMAQYAIRGYEVDALDFILKPVNYFTFSVRFARAISRVKKRESKVICLNLPEGVKKIQSHDIYYVDIQDRVLHYHTVKGEFQVRGTLKQAEEELSQYNFARCNYWYLVNVAHVSEIRKNLAIVAGEELEISRRNRTAFLTAVTDYMGEGV